VTDPTELQLKQEMMRLRMWEKSKCIQQREKNPMKLVNRSRRAIRAEKRQRAADARREWFATNIESLMLDKILELGLEVPR
jgi:hypothetical protein